jgi:hypothetical protein
LILDKTICLSTAVSNSLSATNLSYKGKEDIIFVVEVSRHGARSSKKIFDFSNLMEIDKLNAISFIDSKPVFKSDPGTAAQVENAIAEEIEYLKFKGFQGSTVQLLETAYDRAIKNNEAFSSLRAQPQGSIAPQQAAKPENIYEQMERVRSAKAASKSVSGSLGSGSPVHKSNSIRESLERNWAKS